MHLPTNPHHRLIIAPGSDVDVWRVTLPFGVQVARWVGILLLFALLGLFLTVGTIESRVTWIIAFAVAFINPVWGIFTIALMGPLFLLDQSKTHMLGTLETLTMGMMAAELRLLDRPASWTGTVNPLSGRIESRMRVYWGMWPHFLAGLFLLLLASSLVGFQLMALREQWPDGTYPQGLRKLYYHVGLAFFEAATDPSWTLKSLWNWTTGMIVAVVAARRMDSLAAARWLKLGGLGLLVACGLALLSWSGAMDLSHIRRPNPDPLQAGRLQGLAGHPGWFGQWVVIMWPGLLLWWSQGRTKRNLVLLGGLAITALALVLTAARAAWLGAALGALAGGLYLLRTFPAARRYLPFALGSAGAILLLGVVMGGEVLTNRIVNLLRFSDRANYYVSGLIFLREHPFGLGLGTHFRFYEWTFTPYFRWYQPDHVTAHSLWLHSLIENGPFMPLLIAGGIGGVIGEIVKSRRLLDVHQRTLLVALGMGLLGMLAVSAAQYFVYLRVVELTVWIGLGALVGLCRRTRCQVGMESEIDSGRGRRLLLLCGVAALIAASANAARNYAGRLPRHYNASPNGGLEFWTADSWRTPIPRDVNKVSFSLYRKHTFAAGTVTWPDGTRQPFVLGPDEYRYFEFTQSPEPPSRFAEPRWLEIQAAPLWSPAEFEAGSTDRRMLGVYVSGLVMEREPIPQKSTGTSPLLKRESEPSK